MSSLQQPEIGKSIRVGGVNTNYHDMGSGAPLVLIHGSGAGVTAYANWRLNMPVLAEEFRVIAPDMLGFGYTDWPKEPIRDVGVWVRHLAGFLDALKLDKVSFVGNSFGGALTMAFMIAHPDRVDRAVLMGAAGLSFPITEGLDYVWGYTPSFDNMKRSVQYLANDQSRLTDDLVRSRYEASIRPGVFEAYSAMFGEIPRQKHIEMLASDPAKVAAIPHEVLLLHGKEDQVIPLDVTLRINRLIKRSDAVIFADCGHWVQIERLASFNRIVSAFIRNGLAG
ncbi:MAG TPA: alpha/beta hydrolase [Alphaproteobacteria bacterium]|nr:alpha/beta hydrolase [Alphaproteobacteria bacterium]